MTARPDTTIPDPPADASTLAADLVAEAMATDVDRGLTRDEAQRRLDRLGPNELFDEAVVPTWRRVLAQFRDPLVYLLAAAVVISVAVWAFEGATGAPIDAIVIAAIVVTNAVIGTFQEARAEAAVTALQDMAAPHATVVRDAQRIQVQAREVVPGDVIVMTAGDTVSADARLVTASSLRIAEASLTGESEPIAKDPATLSQPTALGDRLDLVFSGTSVVQGTGRAIVTHTGMATQMGSIADLLQRTDQIDTPLEQEMARVGRVLGIAVIVIAVVVMAAVVATSDIGGPEDLVAVLLLGVSLAVAAVPEGLPAILSVVLALGVQRMARHNAIVKHLSSVETLGSATVVCSDKTGTLTRNEMMVQRVLVPSGGVELTGAGYDPDGQVMVDGRRLAPDDPLFDEVALVLGGGSFANDADLSEQDGTWTIQGDPTEAAFLVAERKLGITELRQGRFHRIDDVPFTSERKLMTAVAQDLDHDGQLDIVTKGAPDVLLGRCGTIRRAGEVVALVDGDRSGILDDVQRLSGQAYRTLAVAYRPLQAQHAPDHADESLESDLTWLGLVAIMDPARDEVADAIAEASRAGVRTMMITGDHPATALRIASDLGIVESEARAVTGDELERQSDEELAVTVRDVAVFARVAPEHKLRIVEALQRNGQVVAMTGDGVNDAPALKAADIGVAMGITGTDVSKQAARMVLADDNFATIIAAVRVGRGIFANIRKFLRYLLSSNTGEVLTLFFGVLLADWLGLTGHGEDIVVPLLAVQILWINLLTDTAPALAMGVDPPMEDMMDRPPRSPDERIIDAEMVIGVGFIGTVMAAVTLLGLDWYLPGGLIKGEAGIDTARTVAFTVLVLAQLFNTLNARSETVSALHHLATNAWLWAALALSVLLQVAVVHVGWLNTAFGTTALTSGQWLVATGLAAVVLVAGEARKVVLRAGHGVGRGRRRPGVH